jgi:hypothetical protein
LGIIRLLLAKRQVAGILASSAERTEERCHAIAGKPSRFRIARRGRLGLGIGEQLDHLDHGRTVEISPGVGLRGSERFVGKRRAGEGAVVAPGGFGEKKGDLVDYPGTPA